jgi:chromosome segregation and condensation protein ScpB
MGIMQLWGGHDTDDDMARANARPLDKIKVDALVQQLKLAVREPEAFKRLLASIESDRALSAAELTAIAQGFAGGVKPKNRKAAIAAIGQERLRLSHAKAKGEAAAKTRTW